MKLKLALAARSAVLLCSAALTLPAFAGDDTTNPDSGDGTGGGSGQSGDDGTGGGSGKQ
ncbi:MAG: hypothetical protein ACXWJH_06360 [Hyphomicrobium sp.]